MQHNWVTSSSPDSPLKYACFLFIHSELSNLFHEVASVVEYETTDQADKAESISLTKCKFSLFLYAKSYASFNCKWLTEDMGFG